MESFLVCVCVCGPLPTLLLPPNVTFTSSFDCCGPRKRRVADCCKFVPPLQYTTPSCMSFCINTVFRTHMIYTISFPSPRPPPTFLPSSVTENLVQVLGHTTLHHPGHSIKTGKGKALVQSVLNPHPLRGKGLVIFWHTHNGWSL